MVNNYVKTGHPKDEQHFEFFDDRDTRQTVEANRVTRGRPRSIYRAVGVGPLVDVHVIGHKQEEV